VREFIWIPGKVSKPEEVKDDDGITILDEDGGPKTKMVEEDSPFEGQIVISIPKYTQRLKYMKEMNFGGKDSNQTEIMERLVALAIKHIKKVDLSFIETGEKLESVDDLEYCKEGADALNSIANKILEGVSLGKK